MNNEIKSKKLHLQIKWESKETKKDFSTQNIQILIIHEWHLPTTHEMSKFKLFTKSILSL